MAAAGAGGSHDGDGACGADDRGTARNRGAAGVLGATGDYVLTGTAARRRMSDPAAGNVTGEALIFHSRDDSVSIEGGGPRDTNGDHRAGSARQVAQSEPTRRMETLIAEGIGKSYKGRQVVRGRRTCASPAARWWVAGAERRRQDHQLLHDRGPGAPETGACWWTRPTSRGCRCTCGRATSASATCRRSLRSFASSRWRRTFWRCWRRSRWATGSGARAPSG
jgi:hypothetical protein